jgi:hypothetical protein
MVLRVPQDALERASATTVLSFFELNLIVKPKEFGEPNML